MEDDIKRARAKKKLIKVTFPSGKSICYDSAKATMVAVLAEIGSDKFPAIKLDSCHLPLLSTVIYPKYKDWMKPVCDGWYINAQSDSKQKYMQLLSINEQLSLGLTIELGADLEADDDPRKGKISRTKGKLLVRFPDGECIAKDSAQNTYLETIKKLGVDNIMRKRLTWGNNVLITTSKVLIPQVQIDERRWIIVPNLTKDKAKLLRVIGAMLHTKLEITVF